MTHDDRHSIEQRVEKAIQNGVRFLDPEKVEIRGELICGKNVEIDINVIFEGSVTLGDNVKIDSHCIIHDSIIAENTRIKPYSLIEGAKIGSDGFVGPYGRVREGCDIGDNVQIGNFVEIKNSKIGDQCRINHMTYLGDAELEENVTVGAGVITCNFNGENVYKTLIHAGVFIGSGTNLIAPVSIGANATIGSGSTITDDVPPDKLTLARSRQFTKDEWAGPKNHSEEQ